MTLTPWREIAIPHQDVLKGTFQQAEFAASLSLVHGGRSGPEYQDPVQFFRRTFITEGMRLLLDSVVRRLMGKGGDPVIQLQTAFGGGKTHTMLAVYHLATATVPASELAGIAPILEAAGTSTLPQARIAVLDGMELLGLASQPRDHQGCLVHTLWGELAWQLGGEAGHALVRRADADGTAPGTDQLIELLQAHAPCVILVDELVRYIAQFTAGMSLSGGTYDTQLSFIQALTEALKAVPTAIMLASLPDSEQEAGSQQQGARALAALEHFFARIQALWRPVATEEAFEIVRRRLFDPIDDHQAREQVCRAFADHYLAHPDDFPPDTQQSHYMERLRQAYPIHPEVFDRLYGDWSALENFQRTRGVLKLMAKVIHRLWQDGSREPLIMPGSLPLYDSDVANELLYYLPAGWSAVVERDVDGERAESVEIERLETRFGSVQACRRCARTIFLGSAPAASNQRTRGLERSHVLLGAIQPAQAPSLFGDALRRLAEQLHYLNHASERYWLDVRPNLRREMEERKRRFQGDAEHVIPTVRQAIIDNLRPGVHGNVHVFADSSDIPDDWMLHLVVLPLEDGYSKSLPEAPALARARSILQRRGDQPRVKQNRLFFLAADLDVKSRLRDQVRAFLAWKSIKDDYDNKTFLLDQVRADQLKTELETARKVMQRVVRETWKWLQVPYQQAEPGRVSELLFEAVSLNTSAPSWDKEIERVLMENEWLITQWAPIHLHRILKTWFWKEDRPAVSALEVWQQCCKMLYLPRLKDDMVFRQTLEAGSGSRDFFGLASELRDGRYLGFSFAQPTKPILDQALLLIEPQAAAVHAATQHTNEAASTSQPATQTTPQVPASPAASPSTAAQPAAGTTSATNQAPTQEVKKRFYGTVDLDPLTAIKQFADIITEVVQPFTIRQGAQVQIQLEIRADLWDGFDEQLQRVVKENCAALHIKPHFETGE